MLGSLRTCMSSVSLSSATAKCGRIASVLGRSPPAPIHAVADIKPSIVSRKISSEIVVAGTLALGLSARAQAYRRNDYIQGDLWFRFSQVCVLTALGLYLKAFKKRLHEHSNDQEPLARAIQSVIAKVVILHLQELENANVLVIPPVFIEQVTLDIYKEISKLLKIHQKNAKAVQMIIASALETKLLKFPKGQQLAVTKIIRDMQIEIIREVSKNGP